MTYLVSAIIPVYNTEKYLHETIESVINQTIGFNKIELVLIDDGSTDNSKDICLHYANKYENVNYHYQKNQGVSVASNVGIELSTGKYLTFIGSDDRLHPSCYELLYNSSQSNNTLVASGKIILFNKNKEWVLPSHKKIFSNNKIMNIKHDEILAFNASPANKIFARKLIVNNRLRYADLRSHGDATLVIPALFLAENISIVKDICYYWRQRDDQSSISQNYTTIDSIKDLVNQRNLIKRFLINQNLNDYKNIMDAKIYMFMQRFINSLFSLKTILFKRNNCREFIEIYNVFLNDISKKLENKLPYLKSIELKTFKSKDDAETEAKSISRSYDRGKK